MTPKAPIPAALLPETEVKWKNLKDAFFGLGLPLPDEPGFKTACRRVFTFSNFVANGCIQHPAVLADLIKTRDLKNQYAAGAYAEKLQALLDSETGLAPPPSAAGTEDMTSARFLFREAQTCLKKGLRRFRLREMIRIAWRDLSEIASLSETMADLTALADACLDRSLVCLHNHLASIYGTPADRDGRRQSLVVIAMGKLGGLELNFSSDIDLIFAYPRTGHTLSERRSVTNDEFFAHLCRSFISVLGENTADGFVFRVDARLRPDGENGPLVMSFDAMEQYYQDQGREWERYAWIKARVAAGDKAAGKRLLDRLKPFVFRRYLDYGVLASLRNMKQKIALEVRRKGMQTHIKLGPGGIREIEFFGQIFQLLRGGVMPELQHTGIKPVLKLLAEKKYIEAQVCEELLDAYAFLRTTENRLQEFDDQQRHNLPTDNIDCIRLAASMGFENWPQFNDRLDTHRRNVQLLFENLLSAEKNGAPKTKADDLADDLQGVWQNFMDADQAQKVLSRAGYDKPETVLDMLAYLRDNPETRALSSGARKRLDLLLPLILIRVGREKNPQTVLKRMVDLLKTIERRTNYIALLLENPSVFDHLLKLVSASAWVAAFLARHPVLLDEFLDPRTLYVPTDKTALQKELTLRLKRISPDDLEYQIEELCIFKQINTLRVAAADVTGHLPLMRVSDYLSHIAETILDQVLEIAFTHLVKKHGQPACKMDAAPGSKGFSIIAYGKLGGLELGYSSDLDLVFLHAGTRQKTGGGPKPIDSTHFYTRLGQRIVHILTAHTAAGALYDVDMRLRPSGSSGMLVVHYDAFKAYQTEKAWIWEHQALLRTRPIIGDPHLLNWFQKTRTHILSRRVSTSKLKKEVIDIRNRLREDQSESEPGTFDLKQDTGGIVDIEFLVQYLVLLNAPQYPVLLRFTDNVRLIFSLVHTGILNEIEAYFLRRAYLIYRVATHRLSLQEKPALIDHSRFDHLRHMIITIWNTHLT